MSSLDVTDATAFWAFAAEAIPRIGALSEDSTGAELSLLFEGHFLTAGEPGRTQSLEAPRRGAETWAKSIRARALIPQHGTPQHADRKHAWRSLVPNLWSEISTRVVILRRVRKLFRILICLRPTTLLRCLKV